MKIYAYILIAVLSIGSTHLMAQDEPQTIRVKKQSDLAKVVFDNTQNKLMVVDRFGNVRENKVLSYKLYVKNGKSTQEFIGYGNNLSPDMLNYLRNQSAAVKLFFTEIKVYDDAEHVQGLPDCIEVYFPDCVNCKPNKSKRRS